MARKLAERLICRWVEQDMERAAVTVWWFRLVVGQGVLFCAGTKLAATMLCGGVPTTFSFMTGGDVNDLEQVEVDDAPPMMRAFGRFVMAVGHRDLVSAWAVWLTVPRSQQFPFLTRLAELAGQHMHEAHGGPAPVAGT